MIAVRRNDLYISVVDITSDYLGPAADRFINRQIRNHLQKDPELLNKSELSKLIKWIELSMSVLTDDNELVNTYVNSLKSLTKN
jgi:hypothetical protein